LRAEKKALRRAVVAAEERAAEAEAVAAAFIAEKERRRELRTLIAEKIVEKTDLEEAIVGAKPSVVVRLTRSIAELNADLTAHMAELEALDA
jgi:iron-sulfur cluster repair protein YtfE (RIC family)